MFMSTGDVLSSYRPHATPFEPAQTEADRKLLQAREMKSIEQSTNSLAQKMVEELQKQQNANRPTLKDLTKEEIKISSSTPQATPVQPVLTDADREWQARLKKLDEQLNPAAKKMVEELQKQQNGDKQTLKVLTEEGIQNFQDRLEKIDNLEDLILMVQRVHVMLHATLTNLYSSQMTDLHKKQREESEEKAAEQRSKKTAIPYIIAGAGLIAGSLLAIFDKTGTLPNAIARITPSVLKDGSVLTSVGGAAQGFANVTNNMSGANLTTLEFQYQRTAEILRGIQAQKDALGYEFATKKSTVNETTNKIHEAKKQVLQL